MRLEYRLDNGADFPVLYYYEGIDKDEISLRYDCNYFVKDGVVYEKTETEENYGTYIIYVVMAEDEQAFIEEYGLYSSNLFKSGFEVEIREYIEDESEYPLISKLTIYNDDDLSLKLKSDYIKVNGRSWAKTSTEIDEDRKVYVYYAVPAE